ncbi:MAG TPA: cell division protein SepF [Acidimicrobiales bacterium]|nr:cell division protein SepF [Acidimicrobiales bacterium]
MASGFFKRTMVYLGLVDDDYEDYEDYEPARGIPRVSARPAEEEESQPVPAMATSTIRPMREDGTGASASVRAMVRPLPADSAARVHLVAPMEFGDARQIADRLMGNQPVIVNLQMADRELMRRMIDFCSGVAYAMSGKMERVADKVFLVTPSNVKVSAEERQRLQENGLLQP